jgi:hypothetical protein
VAAISGPTVIRNSADISKRLLVGDAPSVGP